MEYSAALTREFGVPSGEVGTAFMPRCPGIPAESFVLNVSHTRIVRFSSYLLCGEDAHSVWLRDLDKTVSRGCSRWCSTSVESEQTSLNSTEVTRRAEASPLDGKLTVIWREGCEAESTLDGWRMSVGTSSVSWSLNPEWGGNHAVARIGSVVCAQFSRCFLIKSQ